MLINDCCKFEVKSKIKAGEACQDGKYTFFTSSPIPSTINRFIYNGDYLIMGTGGSASLHHFNGKFATSTDCFVLKPKLFVYGKYLYYVLKSKMDILEQGFKGSGLKHTNKEYVKNIEVGNYLSSENQTQIINKLEQKRIADYLDSKCAKIDSIIEKQHVIIERLKEYKVSMINEMTNVEEGTLCHLGFIGQMKNGLNFKYTSEGVNVKFLGISNFKHYFFLEKEEQFSTVIVDMDISEDYYLKDSDIIFVRSNGSKELVGRAVMVNNISFPLTYSGFCIRFRNIRQDIIDNKFLLYYFRSHAFRKKLEKYSYGSNINIVNQDLLSSISIVIPPIKYQKEALKKLEINCNKIDEMVCNTITIINKLIEYKQSLIYEVVTGKKEV